MLRAYESSYAARGDYGIPSEVLIRRDGVGLGQERRRYAPDETSRRKESRDGFRLQVVAKNVLRTVKRAPGRG